MTFGPGWLRKVLSPDDARGAIETERARAERVLAFDDVDPAFRLAMAESADPVIGRAARDAGLAVRFDAAALAGRGHGLVLGSTGSGKTRAVAQMVADALERFAVDPHAPRPWVIDHKGDLAELAKGTVADLVGRLDAAAGKRLLDALVVVDPFSTEALVPLQVLAREPGTAVGEELQAYEVASLFERLVGAALGVKQDALVFHLLLLAISRGMSLPELPPLLADADALKAAAALSPHPDVRAFFGPGYRPQLASIAGLQARFSRLLCLPSTRLMLSARECVDFGRLLREKVVIADFGRPPLGAEDLSRFWSGFVTIKATRAIFARPQAEASRRVLIVSDEWQEGLQGGADAAEQYERVLSMSRSKGIGLVLVSQSLAGAAKVSASLPRVVSTNTSVQLLFRASIEDARSMSHLLPVTGRRLRGLPLPWERERGSPFLTRPEELNALVEEVASLPERAFYFWHRGAPYRAQLVRSAEFDPAPTAFLPEDVARRVRVGSAAVPLAELEAHAVQGPSGGEDAFRPVDPGAALGPSRRPRRGGF